MKRHDHARIETATRYAMWSAWQATPGVLGQNRARAADEIGRFLDVLGDAGAVARGVYDLTGLRHDADFMIWWHARDAESLQAAYARLRRATELGRASRPVWNQMALHRPAEFNKSHVPAFVVDEEPKQYVCVYPFVRSPGWYLLPAERRRRMLTEHGIAARGYKDVRANTVPAFGLGDHEWILAFEADELHRIHDLMHDLRATHARRHVCAETPFFTGRRVSPRDLVAKLP